MPDKVLPHRRNVVALSSGFAVMKINEAVKGNGDGEADGGDECDPDPHALERCDSHDSWINCVLWKRACAVDCLKDGWCG